MSREVWTTAAELDLAFEAARLLLSESANFNPARGRWS